MLSQVSWVPPLCSLEYLPIVFFMTLPDSILVVKIKPYKRYTKEFKLEAIRLVLCGDSILI